MTSPTGPGPLSVGSPAAVLAIVPHLLGFTPAKSLVILGAGQPRGRIHVTFRFDLPDPPDPDATAAIAAHAVTLLNQQELTMAIVIGYGPGPLVTPLADAIRDAVTGTDLQLRDVLPDRCPPWCPATTTRPSSLLKRGIGGRCWRCWARTMGSCWYRIQRGVRSSMPCRKPKPLAGGPGNCWPTLSTSASWLPHGVPPR